jgi:hypothetical protein
VSPLQFTARLSRRRTSLALPRKNKMSSPSPLHSCIVIVAIAMPWFVAVFSRLEQAAFPRLAKRTRDNRKSRKKPDWLIAMAKPALT